MRAQEDVFVPTLSVWETLAITTNLRMPQSFSASDKEALMLDSLRSMGLLKVKNSQVRRSDSTLLAMHDKILLPRRHCRGTPMDQ